MDPFSNNSPKTGDADDPVGRFPICPQKFRFVIQPNPLQEPPCPCGSGVKTTLLRTKRAPVLNKAADRINMEK